MIAIQFCETMGISPFVFDDQDAITTTTLFETWMGIAKGRADRTPG